MAYVGFLSLWHSLMDCHQDSSFYAKNVKLDTSSSADADELGLGSFACLVLSCLVLAELSLNLSSNLSVFF